jgi:flagellar hook-associated protein FlgK
MGLGLALSNAVSGLRANQKALGVLSHNIANANTEGYSRELIQQQAVFADGVGNGVKIDDVVRNIDKYLSRSILSQTSTAERSATITDYNDRIQIMLGNPGSTNTLDEYVTDYFSALQQLAETPERTSFRSNAIGAAQTLARNVADLAFKLEDLRFQADRDITEAVNAVNSTIRELDGVNVGLASASVLNQSKAGLEDQRDQLLRKLSKEFNISTTFEQSGAVSVYVGNGITLLGDGTRHELSYIPASSAEAFANDSTLTPLRVISFDKSGKLLPNPSDLISGTTDAGITTNLTGGSIKALKDIRDDIIPEILTQLDTLAATLRDEINRIHNDGTGFPPAQQLTGTRSVRGDADYNWSGKVRIAALTPNGEPVAAPFADENYTGWRPLTLDLDFLDSGQGKGKPTVQTIVDEINNHFRAPSFKTTLGNMNNIQLVSDVTQLPTIPAEFKFDFDLENISNGSSKFFVNGFTVLNNVGTNITNITQDVPRFTVDPVTSYNTTTGSNSVQVRLTSVPAGLQLDDYVYLSTPPAGLYNGIPAAQLGGFFKVSAISGNDITITVSATVATGTGFAAGAGAGVTASPKYDEIAAGDKRRTRDAGGIITADLTLDSTSPFYDVTVDVATIDESGTFTLGTITYRIINQAFNLLNDRYDASVASGGATRVAPNTTQDALRAILVDADGVELPKVNGAYDPTQEGFLKILGSNDQYAVGIDELTSKQEGRNYIVPIEEGTNRGFSHFFELNNFFESNKPIATGDTLKGSALNMKVAQRISDNPNLISMGELVQTPQSADPTKPRQYTYGRNIGDNSIAQRLGQAGIDTIDFDAAGGLPQTKLSFNGYTGELLGYVASQTANAESEKKSTDILLNGYKERSDAISNVNLDEELASTIVYQNAYSASARIVSVVDQLFSDLIGLIR